MDMKFLLLMAVPLMVPFVMKLWTKGTILWRELAICTVVTLLLGSLVYFTGRYSEASDHEIWNGRVTQVYSEKYQCYINGSNGCKHYHDCNCVTTCSGSGNNRTCTTTCDSCPDYKWEQDYFAGTTIGRFDLGRGDRQGKTPSTRWTKAYVGEPVSEPRPYTNWVKAVPDSIFNKSMVSLPKETMDKVPAYPIKAYNTWYVDRVMAVGVNVPNIKEWNFALQNMLADIGPQKQANMVILFVAAEDSAIRNAARVKWIGGKKNDVILIIGTNGTELVWADVFSWSKNGLFDVNLREDINAIKTLDLSQPNAIIDIAKTNINEHYVRRPMQEFEYLKDEIQPPTWVVVTTFLLSLVVAVGSSVIMHKNELFNSRRGYY